MFKLYLKILIFLCPIALLHGGAYILYTSDIPYFDNDVIRQYQLQKLARIDNSNVDTIFVGDSSLGRSINADLFSKLSNSKTLNLALTGSYGVIGPLHIVKHARLQHPEIKNIIFMHSLYRWSEPFSKEGYFKTMRGISTDEIPSDFFQKTKKIEELEYVLNLKSIYRFFKYLSGGTITLEEKGDYFYKIDGENTFHDGTLQAYEFQSIEYEINRSKVALYKLIDQYCLKENLNCIFIHGPIHKTILQKTSNSMLSKLNNFLNESISIIPIDTIFAVEDANMGNGVDHVDITHKDEITQIYYAELKTYLH